MLAFKPAEKPLSQKLIGSWIFQVALLGLLLVSVYMIIKGRSNKTLEQRMAEIEAVASQVTTTQSAQTAAPPPPGDSVAIARPAAQQGNPPPTAGFTDQAANNPAAGSANPNATPNYPPGAQGLNRAAEDLLGEPSRAQTTQVRSLKLQFLEVQRMVINDLINNTRNLTSYDTYNAGVVTDLSSRMSSYGRGMRVLDSGATYPVRLNQPIVLFKGVRDEASGANIGVTVQLTPISYDDSGLTVQAEVMRVVKEAGGSLGERAFQETWIIPKDGGAYMSGMLPRRELSEEEKAAYNQAGVLRVLNSGAFQKSTTDFVILIEGK